jgi:hypothetical protein
MKKQKWKRIGHTSKVISLTKLTKDEMIKENNPTPKNVMRK